MSEQLARQLAVVRWLVEVLGFAVFPVDHPALPHCIGQHSSRRVCEGRGKHPAVRRWSEESTTDPARAARLFSAGPRNIGVDAGRSGLLVLDEDAPGELDRAAADVGAAVPVTFTVRTAKGRHLYLRQPDDGPAFGNTTGALRSYRIDVRGRGGFVVGPGSLHASGHEYRPVDPYAAVVPVPAWVGAALRSAPSEPAALPVGLRDVSPATRQALAGVLRVVLAAPPGQRNSSLYWSAARLWERVRDGHLEHGQAAGMLDDAAAAVGLPAVEARATIASAQKRVLGG